MSSPPYRIALLDWLACACAGARSNAARAVRATGADLLADVAFAATAGHVLDYDDTFAAGVAHVSAACAPAALTLAAHLGLPLHRALSAYAEGFEAMAAIAEASHPALYDRGWHPTAVCGPAGAATAAAALLELDSEQREQAVALALLRTGGARWPFGSDGKAIQVGLAAQAGVQAALLARAGARVDIDRTLTGLTTSLGIRLAQPDPPRGIEGNWIKLYPSCLGTHAPIEAASQSQTHTATTVVVDPVSRQAAHIDHPADGLEAKFSIQYCVAHTQLRHRPPRVADFDRALDPEVASAAAAIEVEVDGGLPPFSAVIDGITVEGAPASPDQLAGKLAELAGPRLDHILDDLEAPAGQALEAAGLSAARSASGS